MNLIPNGYRLLEDEEVIPERCLCFGKLESGVYGWGKPPSWLVGQSFCDGWCNHPAFIAVKTHNTPLHIEPESVEGLG